MLQTAVRIAVVLLLLPIAGAGASPSGPLAEAVKTGDLEAVRTLLRQNVDVNAPEPDGTTALHWAAHHGDLAAVDLLLRAGAGAAAANHFGVTPLSLAAANGDAAVVERLLESGADPDTALPGRETVLMTAARAGRIDAVRALLAHGADVNAREETRHQTALMWAAAEGHADVVRALIGAGADIRALSRGPSLPMDADDGSSKYGSYERIAPRVDTFTPLQFAVQAGRIEAAQALLDAGAGLEDETPQGMPLLTLAVANAHYELAARLAERGADVNADNVGFAPLHQLVRVRTLNIGQFPHPVPTGRLTGLELAQVLLEHGATVDARNTKRWQDGFRGKVPLDATPFLLAAKGGDAAMMQLLADHGADPLAVDANGTTAVMFTAGVGMSNPNEDNGTDADALEALRLAVALGGDVNTKNVYDDTAVHGAVFRATTAALEFLAANGARLDVRNRCPTVYCPSSGDPPEDAGRTPLEIAVNGIGLLGGYRPEAAAVLRRLMVEHDLNPAVEEDKGRFSFGVTTR